MSVLLKVALSLHQVLNLPLSVWARVRACVRVRLCVYVCVRACVAGRGGRVEPVAKRRVHHSGASAGRLPAPDGPPPAPQALRGPGPLQAVPARGQHEAHPQAVAQIPRPVTDIPHTTRSFCCYVPQKCLDSPQPHPHPPTPHPAQTQMPTSLEFFFLHLVAIQQLRFYLPALCLFTRKLHRKWREKAMTLQRSFFFPSPSALHHVRPVEMNTGDICIRAQSENITAMRPPLSSRRPRVPAPPFLIHRPSHFSDFGTF